MPLEKRRLLRVRAVQGQLPARLEAIRSLAAKSGDERFLLSGFDSLLAVPGADPGDRIGGGKAGQDGETGQRRTRAPMAAETTDFHLFPSAGTVEKALQRGDDQGRVTGNTEVRPVEVIVDPRRPPPVVEVKPVVGLPVTRVGGGRIERHRGDLGAVGQGDYIAVPVHFELAMMVTGVSALGRLSAQVPVHLMFSACHDHTGLSQSPLPNG
jgi:hypothetical protein